MLSSPSGAGKSTIAKHLLAARDDLAYSVSATTRAPRSGEEDGVDYRFLSPDDFSDRVAEGRFLEWATYGGERYGTLRETIEECLAAGRHVVLDIEVEGAARVRKQYTNAVSVFVVPPSGSVLAERLVGRHTEAPATRARRLRHAVDEVGRVVEYDYVVVNDDLVQAVDRVAAILDAESLRVSRRKGLEKFISNLRSEIADQEAIQSVEESTEER